MTIPQILDAIFWICIGLVIFCIGFGIGHYFGEKGRYE